MKAFVLFAVLSICCINAVLGDYFCRVNGVSYASGTSLGKQVDGCNNCSCSGKLIACTLMWCDHDTSLACELGGKEYLEGDVVPSEDCERCDCSNGNVVCYGCPS